MRKIKRIQKKEKEKGLLLDALFPKRKLLILLSEDEALRAHKRTRLSTCYLRIMISETLEGPYSAVSKQNLANEYSLESSCEICTFHTRLVT